MFLKQKKWKLSNKTTQTSALSYYSCSITNIFVCSIEMCGYTFIFYIWNWYTMLQSKGYYIFSITIVLNKYIWYWNTLTAIPRGDITVIGLSQSQLTPQPWSVGSLAVSLKQQQLNYSLWTFVGEWLSENFPFQRTVSKGS